MKVNGASGQGDHPFSGRVEKQDPEAAALAKAVLGQRGAGTEFQASLNGAHPKTEQIAAAIFRGAS